MQPLRVLLVHANPFQRITPVPPYGLERIRTAALDTGAEIEILDPFLVVADDPIGEAVRAAERLRPDLIGLGLRVVDDCIVIDRLDAPEGEPFDVTWFLPEQRRLRRALAEAAPQAVFVAGGAAFSAFPQEILEYLELDYGVVGAGEDAFRLLVERIRDGEPLGRIPGLVRRGDTVGIGAYVHAGAGPTLREPLYAPPSSFPVRTRIGCAMQCAYCLTANLLRSHTNASLEPVLDEIERTVETTAERGIGQAPIFFADDEFNLPDERHSIGVLKGLVDRGLADKVSWRGYFNPTPFSEELAELTLTTNGHVSITVDTAAEAVMARAQKPFRRRHLDALIELLTRHGVPADLGLIFGLPGETEDTIAETVAWVKALPPEIEVVYSAGARVYPHTPLARIARQEPERLLGADSSFLAPVVYSSPAAPRELARRLEDEFAGLPNVERVGVGYGSGRETLAQAYRAVLGGTGKTEWRAILDRAARPGDFQRTPPESLAACMQVALWHNRLDLAAAAAGRLLKQKGELPRGVSRRQLRLARLAYGGLGAFDRLAGRHAPR